MLLKVLKSKIRHHDYLKVKTRTQSVIQFFNLLIKSNFHLYPSPSLSVKMSLFPPISHSLTIKPILLIPTVTLQGVTTHL